MNFKNREKLRFIRMSTRPAYIPILYIFEWWGLAALALMFVGFKILQITDTDYHSSNVPEDEEESWLNDSFYKYNTYFHVVLQGLSIAWGCWIVGNGAAWYWLIPIFFFIGNSGGIAIITAHELIHRIDKFENFMGALMLSYFGYASFKVEHVRGHHVHVSTPGDASSSKLNQSVYEFVPQAIVRNLYNGFRLENERLKKLNLPWYSWENELLRYGLLSFSFFVLACAVSGVIGGVFFLFQALFAVVLLEIINYIEHYGLERTKLENGRYERVTPLHSWNVRARATMLNLMRHSDHHAFPSRRYQILRHYDEAPQLPGNYGQMILLTLQPNKWFKKINPLAIAHMEKVRAMAIQNGERYMQAIK
jgi:alkane 1-monooxygenase